MSKTGLTGACIASSGIRVDTMITTTLNVNSHKIHTRFETMGLKEKVNSIIDPFRTHIGPWQHHSSTDQSSWTLTIQELWIEPI